MSNLINNQPKRGELFEQIRVNNPARTAFNLSFENKLTCSMGKLIPCYLKEVLPGDVTKIESSMIVRFQPTLAPFMHRVDAYIHYFFVPNRLLWSSWREFISPGNGNTLFSAMDTYTPPAKPYFTLYDLLNYLNGNVKESQAKQLIKLLDYIGIPIDNNLYYYSNGIFKLSTDAQLYSLENVKIDILPILAYAKVYDEYYRDENLQTPLMANDEEYYLFSKENAYNKDGKVDEEFFNWLFTKCSLLNRAWEKDYFTTALPQPQKGKPVTVASNIEFPNDLNVTLVDTNGPQTVSNPYVPQTYTYNGVTYSTLHHSQPRVTSTGNITGFQPTSKAVFNFTDIEGKPLQIGGELVTINQLRRAMKLQEFLEKQARAGSRYTESIKAHFGVNSSDARLQRPEYLGGGRSAITISEVLQNSETQQTPLGTMGGHALGVTDECSAQYGEAEEHGFIIGILSIMPRTGYGQGLSRMFTRMDYTDYAFPEFAHLGEQPIYNYELALFNASNVNGIFGYTPRYAEYKYNADEVHGDFKTSLAYWNLNRLFDPKTNEEKEQIIPNLNADFIRCTPSKRIFAVVDENEDECLVDIWHEVQAIRPLPKFGTPSF